MLISCQNDQDVAPQDSASKADTKLKTAFATSLSKALVAEKPVRDFIKNRSTENDGWRLRCAVQPC